MENVNQKSAISPVVTLERYLPEPKSRLGLDFKSVLSSVAGVVQTASGANLTGIDPGYVDLINKQIETQQQMQLVSMESNIEKSKHETQMAAIRNIRVG